MSRIIQIDAKYFSIDGLVPLYRGDDWSIEVRFLQRQLNYLQPVDMTGSTVTAYFPTTGTSIAASVDFTCQTQGTAYINLPASGTSLVKLNSTGMDLYAVEVASGIIQTYTTENQPVEILDRPY